MHIRCSWKILQRLLLLCLLLPVEASKTANRRVSDDFSPITLLPAEHAYDQTTLPTFAKGKYTARPQHDGFVFNTDIHYLRRRRRDALAKWRSPGVRGLARSCGRSCSVRLQANNNTETYFLHLHSMYSSHHHHGKNTKHNNVSRLPDPPFYKPLVQFLVADDKTTARLSNIDPVCMYKATVQNSSATSVVNLCEEHGSLFGVLALPSGVYTVEPVASRQATKHRMQPHLLSKLEDQHFLQYDYGPGESPQLLNITYEEMEWDDVRARKRRSRRSATSWEYHVEVLVVADLEMVDYHGNNLESYILTLFSAVASIYRHPSLRAAINIVVVRIVIVRNEQTGPKVTHSAQESLQNFCMWQKMYNEKSEDSQNHHDVAILLTRKDICRFRPGDPRTSDYYSHEFRKNSGKCETLGLAELGTMCDFEKSCAIIEDNGLSSIFTIAHELAHLFNIPHDDDRTCLPYMPLIKSTTEQPWPTLKSHEALPFEYALKNGTSQFHIMAPTLEFHTQPWSWSRCSSGILEQFLERRSGTECLFDRPINRKYYDEMFDTIPPGAKYNSDQQCKFVFGQAATLCPYMPTCRRLWCSVNVGAHQGCRTQHMPWADGTICKPDGTMFCHRGECLGMSPSARMKVDGQWGDWAAWGECSRTCGGGIKKASRECDSPAPAFGGKYCVGVREQYASCNVQPCPWDMPNFRAKQCSEFDNNTRGMPGVPEIAEWIPKYEVAPSERCKLFCRVKDGPAFFLLKPKVIDGTSCDQTSDDICVDGVCRSAGCDHILGSLKRFDRCGICGGDGSTCKLVSGSYNERGVFGYNEVLKIPAGSSNIDIRQRSHNGKSDDDTYLSLVNSNGEPLLNGKFQVAVYKMQISLNDVILEYTGSDTIIERINGTGPTRHDLFLTFLSVGNLNLPHITYEFYTALPTLRIHSKSRPSTRRYRWQFIDTWSPCSRICDGDQFSDSACVDATTQQVIEDRFCVDPKPQPRRKACNTECITRWTTYDMSECSAKCGAGEKKVRPTCIRIDNTNTHQRVVTHDSDCPEETRPKERAHCFVDCTGRGGHWTYSLWSECSASCGTTGISRRAAHCVDFANRPLPTLQCDSKKKDITEKPCNRMSCPKWNYGIWSEHDYEKCNTEDCVWWEFGEWSACIGDCARGVAHRTATCKSKRGAVDAARCSPRERIVTKECDTGRACLTWKTSEWTMCDNRCGEHFSTRRVECSDSSGQQRKDEDCINKVSKKPDTHRACPPGLCAFWRNETWSRCSVTCGAGRRVRKVYCILRDEIVDDSFCTTPKPITMDTCRLIECAHWEPQPWGPCSATCGTGNQTRTLVCMQLGSVLPNAMCTTKTKPRNVRYCERDPCPGDLRPASAPDSTIWWATGSWTECSEKCGAGTQRRLVKCRNTNGDLPENACSHLDKVQAVRKCEIRPCTRWSPGTWQQCPSTCGEEVYQERLVKCVDIANGLDVSESLCDMALKPSNTRNCNLRRCPQADPPMGIWITKPWSSCSVSCGGGWRTRNVECSSLLCHVHLKPSSAERCATLTCPTPATQYTWQLPAWGLCSATCGSGIQTRKIWCEEESSRKKVANSYCPSPQPESQRVCVSTGCSSTLTPEASATSPQPSRAARTSRWSVGSWSACSAACGRGMRHRAVACVDGSTSRLLPSSACDSNTRPIDSIRCRIGRCPRWRSNEWQPCSATCGEGLKIRSVICSLGRRKIAEGEIKCAGKKKPITVAKCRMPACPTYNWTATAWSKCIDPCSRGNQTRSVYCMKNKENRAAARMCKETEKPIERRKCPLSLCPYEWWPSSWGSCSKTCGHGVQSRSLDCRLKAANIKTGSLADRLKNEPVVSRERCGKLPKPPTTQQCSINDCAAEYKWVSSDWGQCSVTCGVGTRRRRVQCHDRDGHKVDRAYCKANRPRRTQQCFNRNCLPANCQEIRMAMATTHSIDGEYTVLLDGLPIRIFCYRMNETLPRAYLTLNPETNFAEYYNKKLVFEHTCPYNGQRNNSCECSDIEPVDAGFTRFSKVRLDLQHRRIRNDDFTFAVTESGRPVKYATAGDCYSTRECPQGRFSIDLMGTGLRIVDDLQWEDNGHRTTSRIYRSENNARIRGVCGGHCGSCQPDRYKGLVVAVDIASRS